MTDEPDHRPALRLRTWRHETDPQQLDPPATLRETLLHDLEQHVMQHGAPPDEFRFYEDTAVTLYDVASAGDDGNEALLPQLFERVARRSEVRRAFRIGEVWLGERGSRSRAVAVLELRWPGDEAVPAGWWLALRRFGVAEGEVGVFHGAWSMQEGGVDDELPKPVDAWARVEHDAAVTLEVHEVEQEPPRPLTKAGVAPLPEPLPDDVADVAQLAGAITRPFAAAGKLDALRVLVFREREYELWEIRGELPCSLDDLVRSIASYSSADAIAVAHVGVARMELPTGSEDRRALVSMAERDGRRCALLQTVRMPPGGEVELAEAYLQDQGEVGEDGWLGVEPKVKVNIEMPAPIPAPGGVVGEG